MSNKISGLYIITNKLNGKTYMGSSNNILHRWKYGHKYLSENGSTKCPKFYSALRKYGIDNFEWKVLLICDSKDLYFYEQRWLDIHFNEDNYNTSKWAMSPMRGHTFSSEHIEKMKVARRRRVISKETGQKISASNRGKKRSKEFCEQTSGENHPMVKYTWELVTQIRNEYKLGNVTQKEMSQKYSVPLSTLKKIIYHYTWK